MDKVIDLDATTLPDRTKDEIWRITHPKKQVVDISSLDEDLQHGINKVVLQDEIDIVRRFLKQRKEQR